MARITGRNKYVSWKGTDVSSIIRGFTVTESQENADATAGADEYQHQVTTFKTFEVSFDVVVNEYNDSALAGTTIRSLFKGGNAGTLLWGAEGTATGRPKGGLYGFVSQSDFSEPYDDTITANVTIAMSRGTVLFHPGANTW